MTARSAGSTDDGNDHDRDQWWAALIAALSPAVYGSSWVPWVRIVILLVILAVPISLVWWPF